MINGRDVAHDKAAVVDALTRVATAAKILFLLDPAGIVQLGVAPAPGPPPAAELVKPEPAEATERSPASEPALEEPEEVLDEARLLVKKGRLDLGVAITATRRGSAHLGTYLTGLTEAGAASAAFKRSVLEFEDGLRTATTSKSFWGPSHMCF